MIKDRKLRTNLGQSSRQDYDEVIVILHTDESALNPDFCRAALANHEFPAFEVITAADMLFPCPRKRHINDRDAEYCRIVPVIPCATFAGYQSAENRKCVEVEGKPNCDSGGLSEVELEFGREG